MKYRKRPVVIEAFYFGLHIPPKWFHEAVESGVIKYIPNETGMPNDIVIETLEGNHTARMQHDYIIKGVKGEIYPCKSDIFEMTYEVVNE